MQFIISKHQPQKISQSREKATKYKANIYMENPSSGKEKNTGPDQTISRTQAFAQAWDTINNSRRFKGLPLQVIRKNSL